MADANGAKEINWQGYRFSAQELEILRSIVLERLGISISAEKDYLLVSRFGKMLKFNNLKDAMGLINFLRNMPESADKSLASFLTTGHTFFFRESGHFGVLSMLLKKSELAAPTVWCAATSSGEELYSIAITLTEAGVQEYTLLGSDINHDALVACRQGIYAQQRIGNVEPFFLATYFTRVLAYGKPAYQVIEPLRQRVILKRLNLLDTFLLAQPADVIFCRNVLIYFNEETQRKVLGNIVQNLKKNGYLFLGHSEPLIGNSLGLRSIAPSVYQKQA